MAKNSFELLGYYIYQYILSFNYYNKYMNENKIQEYDYIIELMTQRKNLLEIFKKQYIQQK